VHEKLSLSRREMASRKPIWERTSNQRLVAQRGYGAGIYSPGQSIILVESGEGIYLTEYYFRGEWRGYLPGSSIHLVWSKEGIYLGSALTQ